VTTGTARDVDMLVVRVGDERVGVRLDDVNEVLPAVALAPLPDAPPMICGVVNLHGTPLPIISLRERLGLQQVSPAPDHHIAVCVIAGRPVGVWVDAADSVIAVSADDLVPASEVAISRHLAGVAVRPDGLLLVYDVRSFLDADDALGLDAATAAVSLDASP
jgi:purine-binding chemotaxis protein CheW